MRTLILPSVLALIGGLASAQPGEQSVKIAPENVYATSGQPNVKQLKSMAGLEDFRKIREGATDKKPAVFLVLAKDIVGAVRASRGMAIQRRPGDAIPELKSNATDSVWLGSFLGMSGSMPPQYVIQSIEISDRT